MPGIAAACVTEVQTRYPDGFASIIEPSAGNGAFLAHLPKGVFAMDIDPQGPSIVGQDFLTFDASSREDGQCLIIGNPPFGKNASTAVRFFNRAADVGADVIAFVVPRTFAKISLLNRLGLAFGLVSETPLPCPSVVIDGRPCNVPCAFQIWARQDVPRQRVDLPTVHADFAYCERNYSDLAIQRVGANAGRVKTPRAAGSPSSHYFLNATGISPDTLHARFACIDFDSVRANTAGNPSIAKTELVALYRDVVEFDTTVTAASLDDPLGRKQSPETTIGIERAALKNHDR
ncbi:hypothetical protein ATO8_20189 [Roseivivax marinus]|uniref:Type II DNA modification enzyme n=1 Tax=Roseivivax marinus TaxID=1379903 RepID=W4HF88_9RHOB|nr:SAM-dependent methyltransferase [Roseivivax marinus]ETW10811.1 hypothetical protein ATO8_20189 [Roseivivax marinus]